MLLLDGDNESGFIFFFKYETCSNVTIGLKLKRKINKNK